MVSWWIFRRNDFSLEPVATHVNIAFRYMFNLEIINSWYFLLYATEQAIVLGETMYLCNIIAVENIEVLCAGYEGMLLVYRWSSASAGAGAVILRSCFDIFVQKY